MKLYVGIWAATLLGLGVVYWWYGWPVALYGAAMFASGFFTHKHSAHLRQIKELGKGYLKGTVSWWDA